MKKLYFFLSLFIAGQGSFAQPTLTATNVNPVIGHIISKKLFTPTPNMHGNAGANQTWDLSAAVEMQSGELEVMHPAATTYGSLFPTANIAYQGSDGSLEYHIANTSEVIRLGYNAPAAGQSGIYSDPQELFHYPFTMNSSFSDTYSSNVITSFDSAVVTGTVVVEADGYGTLITPAGTYTDVLRIHSYMDEIWVYYNLGAYPQDFHQYTYWKPGLHFPIAEVTHVNSTTTYSHGSWATSTVGIENVDADLYKISVFPNPVESNSTLTVTLSDYSDVRIEVKDLAGRMVKEITAESFSPGIQNIPIDVTGLNDGMYLVAATINEQTATVRIVVNN